ncbi:Ca-activated chloride channel family protein [Lentibacillus persicus]|uniref:Ca-activated chloride channel family protein n=1 Tax=Lentibacillus persicus TaxID=640948 RepID=A0A1I1WN88_9BACI|nr:VWA domain-containing protein [Lentibacillus persicus]SFD94560.1 Ca-activated chloride channel family protein [Lentibacillus persicus]
MSKKFYMMIIAITLTFITAACDNNPEKEASSSGTNENVKEEQADSNESDDKNGNTEEAATEGPSLDELPQIPTDVDGLANQTPGPFANAENLWDMEQEVEEKMQKLGKMSENPTDEEYKKYLRYIYSLVAQDYPSPEDMIKKWEFASFGSPDLPDTKFHFKDNYNIEIVLDSSGSMANPASNGTRMDVAKKSINNFLSEVPNEANVSLRVYGHKGTGADNDKEMSCDSIEQVYGFEAYEEGKFQEALNQFQPKGWTPLADALTQAQDALKEFNPEKNTNLIYVVSDGIETCDGDPVEVAKSLSESNASPIINIIGFQTDAEAQKQLEEMAKVSGGIFASANNEEELQEEFDRAEEVLKAWKDWKDGAIRDLDAMEVDNSFDIMALHNDWSSTTLSVKNNMNRLSDIAENLGFYTLDQKQVLKEKIEQTMEGIEQAGDQLEKDLEELSKQKIEEAKKSVEDKFNKQTEN